jgi:hypothetical protein
MNDKEREELLRALEQSRRLLVQVDDLTTRDRLKKMARDLEKRLKDPE